MADAATIDGWQTVVEGVKPAVVSLHVTAVRSFHEGIAGPRSGTAFVVDAERGLLLTNRHVCTCGPQRVTATFVGCPSMEEVPVDVAYVDPGHDFAILRFDPQHLKVTPHVAIKLDPAGCRIKEEICMLGNDSNEKMQILRGTIARVDRNRPEGDGCDDENTFYALASAGSCGDSSGSPVINRNGHAVGLYVTGKVGTVHAFLLPLQRVARALRLLQEGIPVTRGTVCTSFEYEYLPECRRLGVEDNFVQNSVLHGEVPEGGTFTPSSPPGGMLVIRHCMPGTLAARLLQPGDVLLKLEGRPCADFVLLEDELDKKVGQPVHLVVCRGGTTVDVTLEVQDFHKLIPQAFVELALGVFHEIPYQAAMKHNVPVQGIYVAQPGFVLGQAVSSDVVIKALNGVPCLDMVTFIELLEEIADNEFFSVSWVTPGSETDRRVHEDYVKMQRQWSLFTAWTLNKETREWVPRRLSSSRGRAGTADSDESTTANSDDASGTFEDCLTSEASPVEEDMQMSSAQSSEISVAAHRESADIIMPPAKRMRRMSKLTGALAILDRSICSVVFKVVQHFDLDVTPHPANSSGDLVCLHGVGVIIDAENGLILTDRRTVPQRLADIEVSLDGDSRCASVMHMHPEHSIVILKLNDDDASDLPFGETATFQQRDFESGDEVDFIGVDDDGRRFSSQVQVQTVRLGKFPRHWPPRWSEKNLEAVVLVEDPESCASGILCDDRGNIFALYAAVQGQDKEHHFRCGYGIPTNIINPILEQLSHPTGCMATPMIPSLEVEFQKIPLQKLQRLPPKLRPPADWLARLDDEDDIALQISIVTQTGPCHGLVKVGDLLVAVEGEVVAAVADVEARLQKCIADAGHSQTDSVCKVRLTVIRKGTELDVDVMVPLLTSDGSARVILWHGLLLQETPRAVRRSAVVPAGVHISHTFLGSPADAHSIMGDFLVSVDGEPTPTLDAVLRLSSERATTSRSSDESSAPPKHLRLESADFVGRRFVSMLKPDRLFWPTAETSQDKQGCWSCVECT